MADDTIIEFPPKRQALPVRESDMERARGFIEPSVTCDTVISGVAYWEELTPDMRRLALFQRAVCSVDMSTERQIVGKLLLDRGGAIDVIRQLSRAFDIKSHELLTG